MDSALAPVGTQISNDNVACTVPQNPREIDTARSRRPHRKSRGGCKRCKSRRVKCDENRPKCRNCYRRRVPCVYFDTQSAYDLDLKGGVEIPPLQRCAYKRTSRCSSAASKDEIVSDSAGLTDAVIHSRFRHFYRASIAAVGTPGKSRLDLRLFHHYHVMALLSKQSHYVWSTWIAGVAVTNPTLMDSLLGFSAFHLRQLNVTDPAISEASHMYMARAIRSHNKELSKGINTENADAVIATASLILFHTSVNQPYLRGAGEEHQLPLHWFRPFRGAGTLSSEVWPFIKDRYLGSILQSSLTTWVPTSQTSASTRFDFLLDDLDPKGLLDPDTILAYRLAVANLSFIYSSPHYAALLRFPAQVPSRFIQLLEVKDPRTLAIVGYFFMLLEIARPIWWIDGAPEREFKAIMALLPKGWWPVMAWALSVFGWSDGDSSDKWRRLVSDGSTKS